MRGVGILACTEDTQGPLGGVLQASSPVQNWLSLFQRLPLMALSRPWLPPSPVGLINFECPEPQQNITHQRIMLAFLLLWWLPEAVQDLLQTAPA